MLVSRLRVPCHANTGSDYERYNREVAEGAREPFDYQGLDLKVRRPRVPPGILERAPAGGR